MKKIIFIIALTLCIFQMVVMATDIDIGSAATNRGNTFAGERTVIVKNNPANESGKITSVEIWGYDDMTETEVVTFAQGDASVFTARDSQVIGTVTGGSKQTFSVDLDVVAGDFIGVWFRNNAGTGWTGNISMSTSGAGLWYLDGDQTSCVDTTFSFAANRDISLYGTGTTEEEGNSIFFGMNF